MKKLLWGFLVFIVIAIFAYIINGKQSDPDFLDAQLVQIAEHFDNRKLKNEAISNADVAWHLDHTLKVINNISANLAQSDPEAYTSNFNIQRIIVHTTGIIPRGAAQSPKSVMPPDAVLLDSLHIQLALARQNMIKIDKLNEHAFYSHAVFGNLNRDATRRFLEVHTQHHLKIIADILQE